MLMSEAHQASEFSLGSSSGLLLINKPAGITSHDVVSRLRRALHIKRIGHAGTLDPFATGLMIVGVGLATRLLTFCALQSKAYRATVCFGFATDTDDLTGQSISQADPAACARLAQDLADPEYRAELERRMLAMTEQLPPAYSAIKINGKKGYELARQGKEAPLKTRAITVFESHIEGEPCLSDGLVYLDVYLKVSKGTYIRSIARDLGEVVGVPAHVAALDRISIESVNRDDAFDLEAFEQLAQQPDFDLADYFIDPARVLDVPVVELTTREHQDVIHGKPLQLSSARSVQADLVLYDRDGAIVAVAEPLADDVSHDESRCYKTKAVFIDGVSRASRKAHGDANLSGDILTESDRAAGLVHDVKAALLRVDPFESLSLEPQESCSALYVGEPLFTCEDETEHTTCEQIRFEGIKFTSNGKPVSPLGKAAICIGAFDGIHEGHRFLINQTITDARRRNLPAYIVTFDVDPDEVFLPRQQIKKLLNNKDRLRFLRSCGADGVIALSFTKELAALDYVSFMNDVLGAVVTPVAIHVGQDFSLGAHHHGNLAALKGWGSVHDCTVTGYKLACSTDHLPISATRIRILLESGELESAKALLGRWHAVQGIVVHGRHEGTSFGFPTANVRIDYPYLLPQEAVYVGFVVYDNKAWPAAMSIGLPLTFIDEGYRAHLEANMIGFSGDIYGREVKVIFCKKLRSMRKFESTDELIKTVLANIEETKQLLGTTGIEVG